METSSYSFLKLSGIQNAHQISCDPILQKLANILGDILGQLTTYPNSANLMASNSEGWKLGQKYKGGMIHIVSWCIHRQVAGLRPHQTGLPPHQNTSECRLYAKFSSHLSPSVLSNSLSKDCTPPDEGIWELECKWSGGNIWAMLSNCKKMSWW